MGRENSRGELGRTQLFGLCFIAMGGRRFNWLSNLMKFLLTCFWAFRLWVGCRCESRTGETKKFHMINDTIIIIVIQSHSPYANQEELLTGSLITLSMNPFAKSSSTP